ncbi:transcriptional regulator [Actinokineospora sp.]|uniref:transcriptional regulator n=1 Tax=Actinokineospora sp. TaxID=1872133 RepID=UPI00403820F2
MKRDRTVPTQLAALAAGVPEATIRKWASRGRLTRYGTPGKAEYSLDELAEIVAKRQSADRPAGCPPPSRSG